MTTPNAVYLEVSKDRALTYRESFVLAESVIASSLKSRLPTHDWNGANRPSRVAVLSANSPLIPLTHWALWSMGAVPSPLSTTSEPQIWAAIIEKLQATAVVVSSALLERLTPVLGPLVQHVSIIVLESLLPNLPNHASHSDIIDASRALLATGPVAPSSTAHVAPTDVAFILFTSSAVDSSTVKGVELTHQMVLHDSRRMVKIQPNNYDGAPRRHLSWLPLGHAFELLCGL